PRRRRARPRRRRLRPRRPPRPRRRVALRDRRRGRPRPPRRSRRPPGAHALARPLGHPRPGRGRPAPPRGRRRSRPARGRAPDRGHRRQDQRRRGAARPASPGPAAGDPLMARDLRLFYLFRLLSTSYLYVPVSVAFALSRGLGLFEVMLLSTVYCAAVILTEVPTGALADRLGRRATMMAGAVAMVAACLTYTFANGFAAFAVATGLAALSMTLCSGADSAYLFDLLNDHGRGDEYPRREGTASAW